MIQQVLAAATLRLRLGRLMRGSTDRQDSPPVPIYLGCKGGIHEVKVGDKVERVPQSRVITRGALVVGEPCSLVHGMLDGMSGD